MFAFLRQLFLKRLEKPRKYYEQFIYNDLTQLYKVIRPGDVLLVEGRSQMSRMIKLFTGSHWSHVAMYVGDLFMAADGENADTIVQKYGRDSAQMLVEAYYGQGVIASPLKKYKDYNIRICRPYGIAAADLKLVVKHVMNRLGHHYDDRNIFAMVFMMLQAVFKTQNRVAIKACLGNCDHFKVICSGMIAQAFQSVGYPIVPQIRPLDRSDAMKKHNPYGGKLAMRHYTQIMPRDFDLSPNFEVIKYNIVGKDKFNYKSLWAERL